MSEYKEIDACKIVIDGFYDRLYKHCCRGKLCTECILDVPNDYCVLIKMHDLLEALEEKQK